MSDLVADIKARLTLQDLIARTHELRAAGPGKLVAVEVVNGRTTERSLSVDTRKQLWSWWAEGAGAGQRVCGGDLISWVAYQRFGVTKVEGERFTDCLKELATLCGLSYDDYQRGDGDGRRAAARTLERQKREIMARYMDVARESWTPVARVQISQRKPWVTAEICEAWGIGVAPSLKACLAAGLSELELRLAGLLRDSTRDESSYMHFRDCIVIPWMDAGETVFISGRRLMDVDANGVELPKKFKSPSMYRPDEDGKRGAVKPLAFNLDTLRGGTTELLIVEGPLDAIACESRGHAAIALGCKSPSPELAEYLARYPKLRLFVALDGTDDVDALGRAQAAGVLGLYTQVCELPAEKDPDDLAGAELAAVKGASVDALDCWCALVAQEAA